MPSQARRRSGVQVRGGVERARAHVPAREGALLREGGPRAQACGGAERALASPSPCRPTADWPSPTGPRRAHVPGQVLPQQPRHLRGGRVRLLVPRPAAPNSFASISRRSRAEKRPLARCAGLCTPLPPTDGRQAALPCTHIGPALTAARRCPGRPPAEGRALHRRAPPRPAGAPQRCGHRLARFQERRRRGPP